MDFLIELDKALFLWLNELHAPWLDGVVYYSTQKLFWTPLYLLLMYLIIRNNKWEALYVLLGIALTIAVSDQLTSGLMKPFFARLRPSHNPLLQETVHVVNDYRGGLYGFPSGHASNSFALAILLYKLYHKKHSFIGWIFLWAAAFSYTRIYLGVHYPSDILVGIMIGLLCGVITTRLLYYIRPSLFST